MIKIKNGIFEKILKEAVKNKPTVINKLVSELQEKTPVDTGNAKNGWKIDKGRIVNEVEYMSNLNHGSSTQAPSYFIENTLLNYGGIKPNGMIVKYI